MIRTVRGDIFKAQTSALVNPVNCVGVCGAGLAKEFKVRFSKNFEAYKSFCDRNALRPGKIFPVKLPFNRLTIINFATKDHWKNPSEMQWIESGMEELCVYVRSENLQSVALPALGCGKGGLAWPAVRRIILDVLLRYEERFLDNQTIFEVYEPTYY